MKEKKIATTLDDVYKTLSPEPLLTEEDLDAFYNKGLNAVRGGDTVARMTLGLQRAHSGAYYKAFLIGHSGVGKSTELTCLIQQVEDKFRPLRFSALSDLDPGNFKPFDLLLIMMIRVVEETAKHAGAQPSDRLLDDLWNWFAAEKTTHTQERQISAGVEAGANIVPTWAKMLGLFVNIKGEMKYASNRNKEIVEYRLRRTSELIGIANNLLDECNELLREATGREWLLLGENFDRAGIPDELTRSLFIGYANIFKDLRSHLVFNLPIALGYSDQATALPTLSGGTLYILDTPVFRQDHLPHKDGRNALSAVLSARISQELFEEKQWMRVIVASGGNLRDLFSMVSYAADSAILRASPNGKINAKDASAAINNLRTEYERRLGENVYDMAKDKVTYEQKAERLLKIYAQDPVADIHDTVLYSLLRARAVQGFNGDGWFGVHPLVVDLLIKQKKLLPKGKDSVLGGSE